MDWIGNKRKPQLPADCPEGFQGGSRYISREEANQAIRQARRKTRRRKPPEPQRQEPPPVVLCPHCDQYDLLHVHRSTSDAGRPLFLLGCNRCNEPIRYVPAETAARIERMAASCQ